METLSTADVYVVSTQIARLLSVSKTVLCVCECVFEGVSLAACVCMCVFVCVSVYACVCVCVCVCV